MFLSRKGKRAAQIALLLAVFAATCFLPGRALASGYTRFVLQTDGGSNLYVFTKPGSLGLEILLRQVYGPSLPDWLWGHLIPQPVPEPDIPGPVHPHDPVQEVPEPSLPPKTPDPEPEEPSSDEITAQERLMVQLVNGERAKLGLRPLEVDMRLTVLARRKSQDMIDKGYFSHTSPTYGSPFDMMDKAGITYRFAGENLAGAHTVNVAHEALMQSDGHRRNILNPDFDRVGIGIVPGGPYGLMVTQMFTGS